MYPVDLHMHTVASTHAYSTLSDYIAQAKQKGIKLFAITDHGPDMEDAPHHWHFINMRIWPRVVDGVGILRGIEANIKNVDGEIDCSGKMFDSLDLIIAGFHEPVFAPHVKAIDEAELVALGKELDVPVVTDLGSGSLVDLSQYGLPKEPMPQELIAAGVSLVSFSGDKLLGGPQAGIIVGKKEMIARLQSHPLKRALRADKMTLAALEATLRLYLHPEALSEKLPTLRLLTRSAEVIQIQAQRLQAPLAAHYGAEFAVQVMPCLSQIGSGSLPVDRLPSAALTFTPHDGRGSHLESLAARWRELPVPVIGRIYDGRLWLDLRCLEDEQRFLEMLLK